MVNREKITLNHKTHNKILMAMTLQELDYNNEDYAANLAKKLNYTRAGIEKQLDILFSDDYIILNKETQYKNKKLYSINWLRLSQDFFDFIKNETKGFGSKKFNRLNQKRIVHNPYFLDLIKSSFYNNFKREGENVKTINEVFNEIFMQMVFYLPLHDSEDLNFLSKRDEKIRDLIIFSQLIRDYIIKHQCDSLDEFYQRISQKRKLMNEGTPKKNK